MKVAFISDTHEDFFVPPKYSGDKLQTKMEEFVDEVLKPKEADILIIAGDTSHYNNQTKIMLEYLASKKMYKKIFITFGNHNLYLVSNSQRSKYDTSWDKVLELKQICEDIDTVEFLDGNIVEVPKTYEEYNDIKNIDLSTAKEKIGNNKFKTVQAMVDFIKG